MGQEDVDGCEDVEGWEEIGVMRKGGTASRPAVLLLVATWSIVVAMRTLQVS